VLKDRIYFPNLDGLRFIAAMMVFFQHGFIRLALASGIENDFITRLASTIGSGGLGVSIFFVLSGFLITYLLLEEHKRTGTISLRNFYMRRVLRIWPLFYFVLLFGFIIYPGLKSLMGIETELCSRAIYYWTFLSNFDEIYIHHNCFGHGAQIQSITWSVSIEEQFYLFWPLLFLFIRNAYHVYIFIIIIAGSFFFRMLNAGDDPVLYFHTFSVLIDLAAGGLAAWLSINTNVTRKIFQNMGITTSLALYIAGFAGLMYWDVIAPWHYGNAVARVFFVLYFVFIILHQNYAPDSWLKLSHNRFFSSMGKYTYGMYLLHPIAILILDVSFRLMEWKRDIFSNELIFSIAATLLTFAICIFSYHYFEKYFLNLKNKFSPASMR
jgi:peptidoglycan/LPS O-acetylase OafA/YrhL